MTGDTHLIRYAAHEAAHLMAASALGFIPPLTWIDATTGGLCSIPCAVHHNLDATALVYAAGTAGEIAYRESILHTPMHGTLTDRARRTKSLAAELARRPDDALAQAVVACIFTPETPTAADRLAPVQSDYDALSALAAPFGVRDFSRLWWEARDRVVAMLAEHRETFAAVVFELVYNGFIDGHRAAELTKPLAGALAVPAAYEAITMTPMSALDELAARREDDQTKAWAKLRKLLEPTDKPRPKGYVDELHETLRALGLTVESARDLSGVVAEIAALTVKSAGLATASYARREAEQMSIAVQEMVARLSAVAMTCADPVHEAELRTTAALAQLDAAARRRNELTARHPELYPPGQVDEEPADDAGIELPPAGEDIVALAREHAELQERVRQREAGPMHRRRLKIVRAVMLKEYVRLTVAPMPLAPYDATAYHALSGELGYGPGLNAAHRSSILARRRIERDLPEANRKAAAMSRVKAEAKAYLDETDRIVRERVAGGIEHQMHLTNANRAAELASGMLEHLDRIERECAELVAVFDGTAPDPANEPDDAPADAEPVAA